MGKSGHVKAWRAQYKAWRVQAPASDASIRILPQGRSPWGRDTEGADFYTLALAKGSTFQAVMDLAAKAGIKYIPALKHLAWAYTANAAYLEVGGKVWSMPQATAPAAVPAPAAPTAPAKGKGKGKGKVS
jgi:hypothetical protein